MKHLESPEIWFITGSQHLYGPETLRQVAEHSQKMVEALNASQRLPLKLVFQPVVTRSEEIRAVCLEARQSTSQIVIACAPSQRQRRPTSRRRSCQPSSALMVAKWFAAS